MQSMRSHALKQGVGGYSHQRLRPACIHEKLWPLRAGPPVLHAEGALYMLIWQRQETLPRDYLFRDFCVRLLSRC